MPHFYVINLACSKGRWDEFTSAPVFSNKIFTRIDAVDGRLVSEDEYLEYSIDRFRRKNGRHPKPGEYGCYLSHVKALSAFCKSDHDFAVILEDDVKIGLDQVSFCK